MLSQGHWSLLSLPHWSQQCREAFPTVPSSPSSINKHTPCACGAAELRWDTLRAHSLKHQSCWNLHTVDFWYYVFKRKLKKIKNPQQRMRGLVHAGCRKLYVTEWWKHLNVLCARQSHLVHWPIQRTCFCHHEDCMPWVPVTFGVFDALNMPTSRLQLPSRRTDERGFSPVKVAVFMFCVPHMCAEKTKHPNT